MFELRFIIAWRNSETQGTIIFIAQNLTFPIERQIGSIQIDEGRIGTERDYLYLYLHYYYINVRSRIIGHPSIGEGGQRSDKSGIWQMMAWNQHKLPGIR